MNKLRIILSSLLTLSVLLGVTGSASAQVVSDPKCETEVYARSYSVSVDTVTANFEVHKIKDGLGECTKDVTVAAWNAPNGVNGVPFDKQTFVDSKSGTFPVGFHSLTVMKPKCFYQVDLLRGLSPYGPNGGVDYTAGQYVSSAHGGEECKPVPPTPQPTPVTPATVVVTKTLPNTGAGEILPIALATGTGAGFLHRIRSRRQKR